MNASLGRLVPIAMLLFAQPAAGNDEILLSSVLITLTAEAEIPARADGPLEKLSIHEGKVVEAGDMVGRVRDADVKYLKNKAVLDLQNARRESENQIPILVAQKEHALREGELQRVLASLERYKQAVSKSEVQRLKVAAEKAALELDQAKYDRQTALLAVKAFENEVSIAEDKVELRRVVAPITGRIVEVNRRQGEWVKAGEPVARIVRVDRLRVEGFLTTEALAEKLMGRDVIVEVDLPRLGVKQFSGQVVFVSPLLNDVNNQIRVWAEIENKDELLRPGLKGSMRILPASDSPTAETTTPASQ